MARTSPSAVSVPFIRSRQPSARAVSPFIRASAASQCRREKRRSAVPSGMLRLRKLFISHFTSCSCLQPMAMLTTLLRASSSGPQSPTARAAS